MKLHVLADRYVDQSSTVLGREIGNGFQPSRGQVPARYADSNHEESIPGGSLCIDSATAKLSEAAGRDRLGQILQGPK